MLFVCGPEAAAEPADASLPSARPSIHSDSAGEPDENLSLWFMGCHLQGNQMSISLLWGTSGS